MAVAGCGGDGEREAEPRPAPPPPATTQAPPTTAPPTTSAPPPPPPYEEPLRFPAGAGAFVWHETDVDPEALARTLVESGFDWAVVRLHDGLVEDPVEGDWIGRFLRAGGPPVGGWGVLRTDPEAEAELAHRLVSANGLAFYIANAEAEYAAGEPDAESAERLSRSRRFTQAFRALAADLPGALSSYCRADALDLVAWRDAGFSFLPQAYVNDFGRVVTPAECVRAAQPIFGAGRVHPTIGSYPSRHRVSPESYARMLANDGATGFSVYLAEVAMPPEAWRALGAGAG
jgi:hypothetical protein